MIIIKKEYSKYIKSGLVKLSNDIATWIKNTSD